MCSRIENYYNIAIKNEWIVFSDIDIDTSVEDNVEKKGQL